MKFEIAQGPICKTATSSPTSGSEQRTGAGGSGDRRHRRPRPLGARAPQGKGWEDRGDQAGILTCGGGCRDGGRRRRARTAAGPHSDGEAPGVLQRRETSQEVRCNTPVLAEAAASLGDGRRRQADAMALRPSCSPRRRRGFCAVGGDLGHAAHGARPPPFMGTRGLKILARTPSRGPAEAAAMACLSRWALAGLAAGPARAGWSGSGLRARPIPVG
jgi:hypothetical protein